MNKIFLTGVTGFLGKVVLEGLLRKKEALNIEKVYLLIRSNKLGHSAKERFQNEVLSSPCFSKLPHNWFEFVEVIAGELAAQGCGLEEMTQKQLTPQITHIINCAASVEFDLPLDIAAQANVVAALNVLELAKSCSNLKSMVNISTAYVTPTRKNKGQKIGEELVPLPEEAWEIYREILGGKVDTKALLRKTGHPNTYTLTKCLSEHLLFKNRGEVPLTIVRPSILSACFRHPFPGWIDSQAAFAGFVVLIGAGYLRAVIAQYSTLLDIVPCDEVAKRIIEIAFAPSRIDPKRPMICHAVAGVANSCSIKTCIDVIENFFRRHPFAKYPGLNYVGSKNLEFLFKDSFYHQIPGAILATWHGLLGQEKRKLRARRLLKQLNYLNTGFPYFTHNTFDFRSSMPFEDPSFKKETYLETICEGVYRHLLKKDETLMGLGGKHHLDKESDFRWAIRKPNGNFAIRTAGYAFRKTLRKCCDQVTFDKPSFEAARAATPKDSLIVIVPTHRSYMDFVLCSYLFFTHPELGIDIPYIAAAEEFSKIPILGKLFQRAQAFYVKRGLGRENPSLTKEVHELIDQKKTLEFFIEGTRSRSRQFLKPRRGMLKCLQATGKTFTILPVAITYDRVPEEGAFIRELKGGLKPTMRLQPFVNWMQRLARGEVQLGRIHLACGKPLELKALTDLHCLGRDIMGELQANTVTTTHHLRCFLKQNPVEEIDIDLDWLCSALMRRGGKVIQSPLQGEEKVDPLIERCFRYHWMHLFYHEASLAFPDDPAIQEHIAQNNYISFPTVTNELEDSRVWKLLRVLFEPFRQTQHEEKTDSDHRRDWIPWQIFA